MLQDRDLSGELKDIWCAVQAKRDTEREHLFQEKFTSAGTGNSNLVVYTEFGPQDPPIITPSTSAEPESTPHIANDDGTPEAMPTVPIEATTLSTPSVTESAINNSGTGAIHSSPHSESAQDGRRPSEGGEEGRRHGLPENTKYDICSQDSSDLLPPASSNLSKNDQQNDSDTVDNNATSNCKTNNSIHNNNSLNSSNKLEQNNVPKELLKEAPPPTATSTSGNSKSASTRSKGGGDKDEKVVKEKKEKTLGGFLHNGLFGKRKDKDKESSSGGGAGTGSKKEAKDKDSSNNKGKSHSGSSFKSKLLLSGGATKEKEVKGKTASSTSLTTIEANMNALNLKAEPDKIELTTNGSGSFQEINCQLKATTTAK